MKHCAKKLLGFAFALALCLAVGGTALAQTPEFADVPAALPEQEMLAYEPNVTAEPGTNTTGDIATDGYTVTIPTTVEVNSGENKDKLKVKAQLKQWRTLNIGITSQNSWQLKYQDAAAGADTPKVDYTLSEGTSDDVPADCEWQYQPDTKTLSFSTTKMQPGTSLEEDMKRVRSSSYELPITVPTPSQATMSGTYSDTVSFEFDLTKQCFTYIINVYGQEVELTSEASGTSSDFGKKYKGLQAVNMAGNANAPYTEQYVLEYGINPDGTVMGAAPGAWQHTVPTAGEKRKAVDGTEKTFTAEDAADYALRWETLDQVTIDPAGDYATSEAAGDKTKTKTIDRNLVRKWYWLDVNGATDYAGDSEDIHGNQGARISGYVNMQVSVDGTNWSSWFWQSDGDDYWGQFPYGIQFKLGFHHVKNGYVYDTGTGTLENGFRIIANKQDTVTAPGDKVGDTTYYVYKGTLTGEPIDPSRTPRYCYIPCYKKGLTYMANQGTGGKEDVNGANKPRTNVLYQEGDELESPEQLKIAPPSTDMVFAGWSTKSTYTTGDTLYQPGDNVSTVNWENYTDQTDLNKRPQLNGAQDKQKRELYAIWGYKTDIKIAFENQWGSTDKDATGVFATVQKRGFEHEKTLKTDEIVIPGQKLTLKMDDSEVIAAINTATTAVGNAATKEKIWDLAQTYTITVPQNKTATLRFEILRKRYLLNVMAVRSTGGYTVETPTGATDAAKYGKFHVKSNDKYQTSGNKVSVYQWLRNYGGSYEVCDVEANPGYRFVGFMIPATTGLTSAGTSTSITDTLTGKNSEIGYFGGDGKTYTGDTIYVVFKEDTTKPGSTTPMPGPSLAPARKALTLRYHANFDPNEELALDLDPNPLLEDMDEDFGFEPDPLPEDVDDALEGAVKTVSYQPGEDVVLRNCMFKRSGYVFVGWNTEPDGTGRLYRVNGVPITDWAAGDTVDLYAQWKKPDHLKPVVDNEPFVPTDPDTPPEELDPGFGIDPDADPADEEGPADDADAVDDAPAVADEEAAAAPPEELDFGFGIDPDAAVGGPAPFVRW